MTALALVAQVAPVGAGARAGPCQCVHGRCDSAGRRGTQRSTRADQAQSHAMPSRRAQRAGRDPAVHPGDHRRYGNRGDVPAGAQACLHSTRVAGAAVGKSYQLWLMGPRGDRPEGLLPAPHQGMTAPVIVSGLAEGDRVGLTVGPAAGSAHPISAPVLLLALSARRSNPSTSAGCRPPSAQNSDRGRRVAIRAWSTTGRLDRFRGRRRWRSARQDPRHGGMFPDALKIAIGEG